MVVGDPDFVLGAILPTEDDPPLLVDPDAPEPSHRTFHLLQAISGWDQKILHDSGLVDHSQLASRPFLDLTRQALDSQATVDALGG